VNSELLRTFVTVVDTGSLSRAAEQLYRTPSAISMQIKRLEEQCGRVLFLRNGRQLELTEEGRSLLGYARQILALHDEALSGLRQRRSYKPLRLGCPEDYSRQLLPDLIIMLRQRFPGLQLEVSAAPTPVLRQALDAGELDLAVVTRQPGADEGYSLFQDRGVWLAAPGFDLQRYDPLPMVLYDYECKFHSAARDGLEKQGREYEVLCTSSHPALLLELVRRQQAITVVASCTVPDDLEILEGDGFEMPPLPAIDVVLLGSAEGHELVTTSLLRELAEQYRQASRLL